MQRLGGGGYTRKNRRGGGNNPSCGCDMQAGWPKFLTENIPFPAQSGGSCGSCGLLPQGGGGLAGSIAYNSNPIPDACPFPGTGYCGFYARGGSCGLLPQAGGANYGEPMNLQARLRGGGCGCMTRRGGAYKPTKKNRKALAKWRKGQSIGFTMTSSLKAKGLIPRSSKKHRGKKVVSAKYK